MDGTVICFGLFVLLCASDPPGPFEGLDPARFEVHDLNGILSPTSLLFHDRDLYLSADFLEAKPGIYRLSGNPTDGFHASLALFLPQQAVEGIHLDSSGSIQAVSGRKFSPFEQDWVNQILTLDLKQRRMVNRQILPISNRCPDESLNCGIVGLHILPNGQWLVATKQRVAKLVHLQKVDDQWTVLRETPITLNRKFPVFSEFQVIEGVPLFLAKDRWALGTCSLSDALSNETPTLNLKTVFDLVALKQAFQLTHTRLSFRGFAEGFGFDPEGNLLVILNNRGFPFRKSPDQLLGENPKLVIFRKENLKKISP